MNTYLIRRYLNSYARGSDEVNPRLYKLFDPLYAYCNGYYFPQETIVRTTVDHFNGEY